MSLSVRTVSHSMSSMSLMYFPFDFSGTVVAPSGDPDIGMDGTEVSEDREEDTFGSDTDSDVHYSEAQLQHQMDKVVLKESVRPNIVLDNLRFKPHSKSKLYIPLCRMRPLEAVRPRLKHDVAGLGAHFLSVGYMDGHGIFYVSLEDHQGKTSDVSEADVQSWSILWKEENKKFERKLLADPTWKQFSNKMFHVWDGNHRLGAWLPIINQDHGTDPAWHYSVESSILVVGDEVAALTTALHQVNW